MPDILIEGSKIMVSRDVPIPPPEGGRGAVPIYPWRDIDVGESFVHPGSRNAATAMIQYATKQTGRRFTSRKEGSGYRIWRVE